MDVPVLVRHDPGCRYARPDGGGHSDAASRLSDGYNLHKAAGAPAGYWMAAALADGASDGTAYPTKLEAVVHQHHNEWWFAFLRLGPASMTVCQAESLLMMYRGQARLKLANREDRRGGYDVITRLTLEDQRRQLEALRTGSGLIGLGYRV